MKSVKEARRALDYLSTRIEIDNSGFGIIGYSMEGMMTFNLTAVDTRIKVSAACDSPVIKNPYLAMAIQNFAPYIINQPFLMLIGDTDIVNYTKAKASNTIKLIFFDSGHMFPDEWTNQAVNWLEKYLK